MVMLSECAQIVCASAETQKPGMSKKLKAIVVGAGWSAEGHTKAFQHYGVEVLAICARKPEVVQKVANRLGVPEASTDWRESLLKHRPDIVALTTPAVLRTEVIELAVKLGCHIISEKPLALTAVEAEYIYNLIKGTGLKHGFAATHLYDPSVAYVRELLTQQHLIGEVNGNRYRIQPPDFKPYVFKDSQAVELDAFFGTRWWCAEQRTDPSARYVGTDDRYEGRLGCR